MCFIVLVPVKIDTFAGKLYEIGSGIKESNFHVMWENEYATEYMIIIIVPYVLVSERHDRFLLLYIHYFKAFLLEIP